MHDLFYKGDIAAKMADFMETNGGLFTRDDLAKFHAETDEPRTTTYRGYTISKPGFWSQGPVMIEALNILEGFDLKRMGHNSPEYLHTVIEAVKLAFADRDRYYGDPKFSKIPEADPAVEGVRRRAPQADRSAACVHGKPPGRPARVGRDGRRQRQIVG